jgi:hypothetical protein
VAVLLRVILVVAVSAIVLAIAYVVVTDPGSGTDVIARGHRPPVHGKVGAPVTLGRGSPKPDPPACWSGSTPAPAPANRSTRIRSTSCRRGSPSGRA